MERYNNNNFLRYICDKKDLNKSLLKAMIEGKINFKQSYYNAIAEQIEEKQEFLPYVKKFESEVNG